MAPKVAAPAAIGRLTRSASKAPATPDSSKAVTKGKQVAQKTSGSKAAASGGSKAAASGGSKAAKSNKAVAPQATLQDARGGGVSKERPAKNAHATKSNPVQKSDLGAVASPLQPKNLAAATTAAVNTKTVVGISAAHKELAFTLLALKVPTLSRFGKRWVQLGDALSGQSLVYNYAPETFIADFVHDVSTADDAVDRPTACIIFERLVELIKLDADIPFNKRAQWVHAYCEMKGQQVPPPYDQATINRYAREAIDDRQAKRRRTNQDLPLSHDDQINVSSSDSETSNDHDDSPPVTQVLNADAVWGVTAGFATVPHDEILAEHKATANDVASRQVNAAKSATITWPSLNSWTKDAWISFDKHWWDCLNQAAQSGLYSTPISLIKLAIVRDIQIDLKIPSNKWRSTTEVEFIRKAYGHFGPNNKEEALALLKTARCTVYSGNISPETFLTVLSTYNSDFLRILDLQIAPTVHRWPKPGEPKSGPLTVKAIRDAFKEGFSACKEKSSSCEHCYNVCKQNADLPHEALYIELRLHFQEDARALERATLKGKTSSGGGASGSGGKGSNGGRNQNKTPYGGSDKQSNGGRANPNRQRNPSADQERQFKLVAGKDRCAACGDYTNHYGHGIKNCPVAGTKHAKPKGYIWKDSDKEKKVNIPGREFAQLKKDKAAIYALNAKNRIEYRAKLSKSENYLASADLAFLDLYDAQPDFDSDLTAAASTLTTHDGSSYDNVPPAAEVLIDVVQMGSRYSAEGVTSLEDLGYSERFFGVAKFLPSTCSFPTVSWKQPCVLGFTRNVTTGRFKRSPRCMTFRVDDAAEENLISAKALSQTSEYGKLKICDERKPAIIKTDPRTRLLLEFSVNFANADVNTPAKTIQAWFIVDESVTMDEAVVVLSKAFADKHDISAQHSTSEVATGTVFESEAVVGRTFFDSGAQMSCIAPHLVLPELCVNRAKVNVQVMQGVHEAGHSKEAVQLCFDLFDNQMVPTRYTEWFLVWDNPYGVILGDSFCEQFTSWRQLLASWTSEETKKKFAVTTTFTDWTHFREPTPKAHQADSANTCKRARPDMSHLRSKHPVTSVELRHRNAGSRPIVAARDHLNYIPFDGLRPAGILRESAKRLDQHVAAKVKEKQLRTMLHALPKDLRCSFDMAEMQNRFARDQRSMCTQIMHDIVGLPQGLMMGTGAGGIVRRASLFEPIVHIRCPSSSEGSVTSEIAAQTAAERYLLHRAAAAEWTWGDDDESHYQELLQQEHVPLAAAIKPTPLTSSQKYTVNWLIKCLTENGKNHVATWTSVQDGVVRDLDQRDAAAAQASAALAASKTLLPTTDLPTVHCFQQGNIIKFKDCVRLTEFNGKLGRLYELCNPDEDRWKIRVLGRNHGQFVIASARNFELNVEQKTFTSSADANFHDVGIDDGGMPIENDEDAPKPVHRQFGKEYSVELTRRIREVLERYPELFNGDISTPCEFDEMDIRLKPNAILPSKARYYRNTPLMREEVRRQIQEQLDAGIISRMPTAVVSNVLMVKRPHMPGRYRFVVDYRAVNDATVPDVLLMPDIRSQHDRLANKKIFGACDISSYYRLIRLKESCRYLTGFATEDGTYVYNRVPMGVRNACSHAQRVLQDKLAEDPILGVHGANIRNYFDDIAWGSNSEDEFITVLTALMEFGVRHKLKYNIEKSCFGVDSITHVGFIADKNGIRIDPERTRDIVNMEAPKSTSKVQSILGTLNFVRNFIPNFSGKAKFLTDRLEKAAVKRDAGKKFTWSPADEASFTELKLLVASAPLLSILDYSKDIYVRCDSSRYGAGAVLFQYDSEGREMPVCYASRKYTATETRYSTFQQEMGCVVWALERFQEYTMGYKVIVETDHRNISFVKRSAMPQLARWRMRLEAFDFDVHYRCGALQQVADGLSRSACDDEGADAVAIHYGDVIPECALANATPAESLKLVTVEEVSIDYQDADLAHVWADTIQVLPIDANQAAADDNDGEVLEDDREQEIPPLPWNDAAAVKSIIETVHNDVAGHGGVLVTLQRLLKRGQPTVSRKQMLRDIDDYLRGCVGCQKMRKRTTGAATTRRVISGSPFSDLSIDVLKLPFPDAYGNSYAVIIVDNFSHWVTAYACANKSALSAARALIHFIGTFGVPLRIRSDGGGEFCNDIVRQFAHMVDFRQIVIQPYLHSANGIVERVNRSVLEKLRFILFDRRIKKLPNLQWTDLLPFAQRIVNASTHSAIGTSPARLIFGDHVDLDRCILSRPPRELRDKVVPDYVAQLSAMQAAMLEAANDHQLAVQQKTIARAAHENRDKPIKSLECGDLVLVKPLSDFPHDKLAPSQLGPLYVREVMSSGLVRVENPHSKKQAIVSDFQCELFDTSLTSSIEGLKRVAETDGFEFAVDGILAHGLQTGDDDIDPTALPVNHVRRVPAKNYAFLIKWTGYETPTWIAFKAARRLPHFNNYVSQFPSLKINEQS
jgi:hypothetical protein